MWYWYVLTFLSGAVCGAVGLVIFFFANLGAAWRKK